MSTLLRFSDIKYNIKAGVSSTNSVMGHFYSLLFCIHILYKKTKIKISISQFTKLWNINASSQIYFVNLLKLFLYQHIERCLLKWSYSDYSRRLSLINAVLFAVTLMWKIRTRHYDSHVTTGVNNAIFPRRWRFRFRARLFRIHLNRN